ncbi:MAG TPA: 2Fe-2S iron-sulfur cluster-binding protein [Blastocatellia bacterium]|nr:2Fe-2S iron-sulfur cluster-binding protein [Blastocatellia bacterium]
MGTTNEMLFEAFLNQHDDSAWRIVLQELLPSIHEVDKPATRIWFAFYPLALARVLEQSEDADQLARELLLQGNYELKAQIDSSHTFLYGHRFWPDVKKAISGHIADSQSATLDLSAHIRQAAGKVARTTGVDHSLLLGMTAVGFMTLQQVGTEAFNEFPGRVQLERTFLALKPDEILRRRARDDNQGVFGFLRGQAKVFTVTFNENDAASTFKLINTQHLTTAAANDKGNYHLRDERCTVGEGPIPVQCRSAACGTCWIGVLGGAEKLSEVAELESRRIKEFGYIDTNEPRPRIRLACQAQAYGAVSIVIPPWNGVFGKYLRSLEGSKAEARTNNP